MLKKGRKGFFIFLTISILLCALCGAAALGEDVENEVYLHVSIPRGGRYQIDYSGLVPEELGKPTKSVFVSSDPKTAFVEGKNVSGRAVGTAFITGTLEFADGVSLSGAAEVTVFEPVSGIKVLGNQQRTIFTGETTEPAEITVLPENAQYKTVTWISSDNEVASVDESGRVTGIKAGKVTITAVSDEPVGEKVKPKSGSFSVTVVQPVTDMQFETDEIELAKGTSRSLVLNLFPEDATNKKVSWISSDPSVATVDSKGTVIAKSKGNATITVMTTDGSDISASCEISTFIPVSSVKANIQTLTVKVDESADSITAIIAPEDAKYQAVTWTSEDETIATVDQQGIVTGHKAGKTRIILTSNDIIAETAKPKMTAVAVTVLQPVKWVSIDSPHTKVAKGKTIQLKTVFYPEDASNKKLVWETSDPTIATVSNNGAVAGKKVGSAVITCRTQDGTELSASYTVTVFQAVTGIRPSKARASVTSGKSINLSAKVSPDDASIKTLNWSSSDPSVAQVDPKTGRVTGKKSGVCTVTVSATDGSGKEAKVSVYVEPVIPLDAIKFTRSGYFGVYTDFAITFKNLTKSRTVKYIQFDLKYDYMGKTYTFNRFYINETLSPGSTRQIGWWDQLGYRLGSSYNFRVYLTSVQYSDGTWESFSDNNLIGWF